MRSLLIDVIVPAIKHPTPRISIPLREDNSIDVLSLIKMAVGYFNPIMIKNAFYCSYKICRIPGYQGIPPKAPKVPQEEVYQTELISVLKHWVPEDFEVIPHPNSSLTLPENDSNEKRSEAMRRSDILVIAGCSKILLVLVANQPVTGENGIRDHFTQATRDAMALGVDEVWVVHFTVCTENDKFKYPYPETDTTHKNLKVIHIYHNQEFTKVNALYEIEGSKTEEEIIRHRDVNII